MIRTYLLSSLPLLAVACSAQENTKAPASQPTTQPTSKPSQQPTEFARFRRINDDDAVFETAIVRYRNADGAHVSLIASVHIADEKHYDDLNREFKTYDALLYELVAPESHRPKKGEVRKADNPLSFLQLAMKKGLELEFQLGSIDYTQKNFVHADLTPEGFQDAMKDRGESILSIMFDMMGRQAKVVSKMADDENKQPTQFDIVSAFRKKEGRHTLRMMFAEQLTMMEELVAGFDPDAEEGDGSVLLEGRNDKALEVLREQLDAGKREIGIYYGAAHMPDIEKKLIRDFGFEKVGQRMLVAWDITKRRDGEPVK